MEHLPKDAELIYEGDNLIYKGKYQKKDVAFKVFLFSERNDIVQEEAELSQAASQWIKAPKVYYFTKFLEDTKLGKYEPLGILCNGMG